MFDSLRRHRCAGVTALSVVLMVMTFSSFAGAQGLAAWNQRTSVTFNQPVEIPGHGNSLILPAGTYVFRLLDSQTNRHIVQVFNQDETVLYSTILAIPNQRRVATDRTVITFTERPAGRPPAIQAWFYPGNNWGHEFAYPRSRAEQLAALVDQPVLFIPEAVAEVAAEVVPTPVPTAPRVTTLREAPVAAINPEGEQVALATVVQAPPVQQATLPRTGSSLPLVALLGLLSIGIALTLRRAVWQG